MEKGEEELRAALRTLKDAEFIVEQSLYPVAEYAFKHPLTQEVALGSQLKERRRQVHAVVAHAIAETQADRLNESAALLAHHYEEAGEVGAAARWHRRAAEWVGLNDIKVALQHWQRVRELARHGGDEPESTALTIAACSQALAHGWRLGAWATEWAELLAEGCAATGARPGTWRHWRCSTPPTAPCAASTRGSSSTMYGTPARRCRSPIAPGDAALRCGTRVYLCIAHAFCGQLREAERVCDEVIELAHEDMHLGT